MKDYFYIDNNGEQKGPISPMQFSMYNISPDTLVWCEGMNDWTRAGSVTELHDCFITQHQAQTPPPYTNNNYNQPQPQQQPQQQPMQPCPDSNLVWAILSTIFCCLPFGIVAIIYACKVNDRYIMGDIQGAIDASKKAKNWSIYGAIGCFIILLLYFILILALGLSASNF